MDSHQRVFLALNMHGVNGEDHEFKVDEVKKLMPEIDPAYYKAPPNLVNVTEHNQADETEELISKREEELKKIHHKKDKTSFIQAQFYQG